MYLFTEMIFEILIFSMHRNFCDLDGQQTLSRSWEHGCPDSGAGCWVFWGKEVAESGGVQVGVHCDVDDMLQV